MKKLLKNRKGVIALITVLILMGVGTLGIGMVITSQLSSSAANNYRNKIKTYSAADGMMTLLAQDILDFNEGKYSFSSLSHCNIGVAGDPSTPGYYSHNFTSPGYDTLKGDGSNIGGTSDRFHFAYVKMSGNIQLYAQIVSMTNTNTRAKAGLMIRQDLTDGAKDVFWFVMPPTSGISFYNRTSAGGSFVEYCATSGTCPKWLRLSKTGNTFTADTSTNGVTWSNVCTQNVTMTDPVYVGLAVSSRNLGTVCTAVFSNLTGIAIQSFTDTVKVGTDSIPVIYNLSQLGNNLFNMSTYAYVSKGTTQGRNYETHLTQMLSRQSIGAWVETAHDSALIPVTLYDFRANSSCPEFQVPGKTRKNMVRDTLDADRKPIPKIPPAEPNFRSCVLQTYTGVGSSCFGPDWYTIDSTTRKIRLETIGFNYACMGSCTSSYHPNISFGWWFNDSMFTWFRPHGEPGIPGAYTFDPLSGQWSGLKRRPKYKSGVGFTDSVANEWVTTNWDSANKFANIVMYDTLKFRQKKMGSGADTDTTIFTFGDQSWVYKQDSIWFVKECNVSQIINYPPSYTHTFPTGEYKFMPLKNRGFGYDASLFFTKGYNSCVDKCNFSFTMEIHRKFTYKPNQTFFFRGDDDVWAYINNHLVIDLGGTHTKDSETVNLDTLHPALVSGQKYWFDFFYCERCVGTSNIYISTNMLLFVPPQPLKRSWKRDYGNLD
jgi:fibro-slime domain-containing protein